MPCQSNSVVSNSSLWLGLSSRLPTVICSQHKPSEAARWCHGSAPPFPPVRTVVITHVGTYTLWSRVPCSLPASSFPALLSTTQLPATTASLPFLQHSRPAAASGLWTYCSFRLEASFSNTHLSASPPLILSQCLPIFNCNLLNVSRAPSLLDALL